MWLVYCITNILTELMAALKAFELWKLQQYFCQPTKNAPNGQSASQRIINANPVRLQRYKS
jgi:hypothetical protein